MVERIDIRMTEQAAIARRMSEIEQRSPEESEAFKCGYRYGYRNGWLAAAQAVEARAPVGLVNRLRSHWAGPLLRWLMSGGDYPPRMPKEKRR